MFFVFLGLFKSLLCCWCCCAKVELLCVFRRVTPKLGMAKVTQVDFPPRETVSYSKETQTPAQTQAKKGNLHKFVRVHTEKRQQVVYDLCFVCENKWTNSIFIDRNLRGWSLRRVFESTRQNRK